MKVTLLFLFLGLMLSQLKSQTIHELPDTLSYKVILSGRMEYQQKQPIIITTHNEYFDFYYNHFGTYPQNFRFNFEKEMVVVFFKTSASIGLNVDYILETEDKIEVVLKGGSRGNGLYISDPHPCYIVFSLKKSDKQIVVN